MIVEVSTLRYEYCALIPQLRLMISCLFFFSYFVSCKEKGGLPLVSPDSAVRDEIHARTCNPHHVEINSIFSTVCNCTSDDIVARVISYFIK